MRILIAPSRGGLGSAIAGDLAERDANRSCAILADDPPTPDGIEARMAESVKALGGLDGLIVVADATLPDPGFACTPAAWDDVMAANTRSVWLVIKAAYPYLKQSKGAVAVVVPTAALVPDGNDLAKGASLASTVLLARVFAQELARDGIRVNIVAAGAEGAKGAADAALFLLGAGAGYISGQTLAVDDGILDRSAGAALGG